MKGKTVKYFASENVSKALPELLKTLLLQPEAPSRNGTMRELRFPHIVLEDPCNRVVTTPKRNALHVAQIAETMWILAGRNDADWLENYLPRALEFSDDGITWRGGYGPRIRHFRGVDQLKHVIDLLNEDRHTRRALISIYDAALDSKPGLDVPCNNWLHFLPRGDTLDLHVATRSNDVVWGWSGINAFEWSVLLEIVAHMTGFVVGELHFSISSLHLYERHYKKAQEIVSASEMTEILRRGAQPKFDLPNRENPLGYLDVLIKHWFWVEELIRSGSESASAAVESFPEPMMRQWLRTLSAHWATKRAKAAKERDALLTKQQHEDGREKEYIFSAEQVKNVGLPTLNRLVAGSDLDRFKNVVTDLHKEKDAAYGTSWKKRGEHHSILPNICRKADRLETGMETGDETQIDTAIDLFVYAIKYRLWLLSGKVVRIDEDPKYVADAIKEWFPSGPEWTDKYLVSECVRSVDFLCQEDIEKNERMPWVEGLISISGRLAFSRWLGAEDDVDEYRGADHD